MKRASVPRTAAALLPLAFVSLPVVACSKQTSTLTERGGSCLLATECAPGLVCVPQRRDGTGPRVCTDDLTNVVGQPPANDAGPSDAATNPDAPQPPDSGTPPQDAAGD